MVASAQGGLRAAQAGRYSIMYTLKYGWGQRAKPEQTIGLVRQMPFAKMVQVQ